MAFFIKKSALKAFGLAFCLSLGAALAGCSTGVQQVVPGQSAGMLYSKGMTAYQDERYEESERYFKSVMEEHPLDNLAMEAQLLLGDVYYAMERYDDANIYYTNFAALHPNHRMADYALFQKGMCHFKEVLSVDRDQTATRKAIFAFQDLVMTHAQSAYVPKAKEMTAFLKKRLAERELYIARFYFKDKKYKATLARLRDLIKEYPDAGLTDTALYYIGESYLNLGEKKLAEETFGTLLSDYPDSQYVKNAREARKRLSES